MRAVACPYFFPTEKSSTVSWAFPQRLPLGAGFCGVCLADGERRRPADTELKEFCNLGYATHCEKIPADRASDAVRFSVSKDSGESILLQYCCERAHAPVENGQLQYDFTTGVWTATHQDACIQRQAECYLITYLERKGRKIEQQAFI